MATMTLLEIVQNILSALDSDEVNSISDTVEALQVATVVKETFEEQFNNVTLPSFQTLFKLDGISEPLSPNYMKIPDDIDNLQWIRYQDSRNNNKVSEVVFRSPEDFLETQFQYTSTSDNVFMTTDPESGVQYYIKTDKAPSYYTVFNNKHLAFDSLNTSYDTTLQSSKSSAFGTRKPVFLLEDDFVPPIPARLFPQLLAESKSVAFVNIKQISSSKEEQRAVRQRIRANNERYKSKDQRKDNERYKFDFSRRH